MLRLPRAVRGAGVVGRLAAGAAALGVLAAALVGPVRGDAPRDLDADAVALVVSGTVASDGFDRTASDAWGRADRGGAWVVRGRRDFDVTGAVGTVAVRSGWTRSASLDAAAVRDSETLVSFRVTRLPRSGNGTWVGVTSRQTGSGSYLQRVKVGSKGVLRLQTFRSTGTGTLTRVGRTVTLPGRARAGATTACAPAWPAPAPSRWPAGCGARAPRSPAGRPPASTARRPGAPAPGPPACGSTPRSTPPPPPSASRASACTAW
nr:hypothetical protein [Angustibacter aerolatus]